MYYTKSVYALYRLCRESYFIVEFICTYPFLAMCRAEKRNEVPLKVVAVVVDVLLRVLAYNHELSDMCL
jgi:hypothetical protein